MGRTQYRYYTVKRKDVDIWSHKSNEIRVLNEICKRRSGEGKGEIWEGSVRKGEGNEVNVRYITIEGLYIPYRVWRGYLRFGYIGQRINRIGGTSEWPLSLSHINLVLSSWDEVWVRRKTKDTVTHCEDRYGNVIDLWTKLWRDRLYGVYRLWNSSG